MPLVGALTAHILFSQKGEPKTADAEANCSNSVSFQIPPVEWLLNRKYRRPGEVEQSPGGTRRGGEEYDAGETTIDRVASQLDLEERDRICYLFDYGAEWRFYAIPKEIDENGSRDMVPEAVKEKGEPVEQYPSPGDEW